MEKLNKKLDTVILKLEKLESRMDIIEKKLNSNTENLAKINQRCDTIEKQLDDKVNVATVQLLEEKVTRLETALITQTRKCGSVSEKINKLDQNVKEFQIDTERELLEKEVYDKRFNLLIHGIEENSQSSWETKWESEAKFRKFLHHALKIPEAHVVAIADVHRLPQHSITRKGKRVTRPIIVKLTSYSDKNLIMRSLKNLRAYNEERKTKSEGTADYVYVTEHLPRVLQQQKKLLLPAYKQAKKNGRRAVWRIEKATYCLYIDNARYSNNNAESTNVCSDSASDSE